MTHAALSAGSAGPAPSAAVTPAGSPLPASTAELYRELCGRARGLARDRAFLKLLAGPGMTPSGALRCALDAEPALELLPLNLLAEVMAPALTRLRRRPPLLAALAGLA